MHRDRQTMTDRQAGTHMHGDRQTMTDRQADFNVVQKQIKLADKVTSFISTATSS